MTSASDHLDPALRVEALASLLTERGLIDEATVETFVKTYEQSVGPMNGAKVVAKAWTDPSTGPGCWPTAPPRSANSASRARRASTWWCWRTPPPCTMWWSAPCARVTPGRCSACRRPGTRTRRTGPGWCASPGRCSASSGWTSTTSVEIRVHDSSSEVRYLVLPERPAGTGHYSEAELADLVTRDAMVGVAKVAVP